VSATKSLRSDLPEPAKALARLAPGALVLVLAACSGGMMATMMPGQDITVGGDTFSVSVDGNRAVAMNFASGTHNQERLYANAQEAIAIASGCAIAHFEKEPGVNTYRARLDCASED